MNIVVTAGNTMVLIDRVRAITNVFSGRTGTRIALHAHERGHAVRLLTSHPEVVNDLRRHFLPRDRWSVEPYRTFDDLQALMQQALVHEPPDVFIHCAAVSDYQSAGVFAPTPTTRFHPDNGHWQSTTPAAPALVDRNAGKIKSDEPELWLRLVRTPKLVDRVRADWAFAGILVKFKLEVGISEEQLLAVAEQSRRQSAADLMVANTLEGAQSWAYLGPIDGHYQRVDRASLSSQLLSAVERLDRERM